MNNLEILNLIGSMHATDRDSRLKQVVELLRRERPHYHWIGIYLLQDNELVLGVRTSAR
jgi:putative methionine-R-sulfoxide reductase with GAF domain